MKVKKKVKNLVAVLIFTFILIISGCSDSEDNYDNNENADTDSRVLELTGHDRYCGCSDCRVVTHAVEMIDILRDDPSYYGVDAITVERDEDEKTTSEGVPIDNFYDLTVYYNVRTEEPIPEESDIWYLTQGWRDSDADTWLINKSSGEDGASYDFGYSIDIEAFEGPDLGNSDYVIY